MEKNSLEKLIGLATGAVGIVCCDRFQCPQNFSIETLLCQCKWSH